MDKDNVNALWFLSKEGRGNNTLIPRVIARKRMFKEQNRKNFVFSMLSNQERKHLMPDGVIMTILKQTKGESYLPDTI